MLVLLANVDDETGHVPMLVLEAAFEADYLGPADLLAEAERLSIGMQCLLRDAVAAGKTGPAVADLIRTLTTAQRGRIPSGLGGVYTRVFGHLVLGFLYVGCQRGRIGLLEMLMRAWYIADSYVCGVTAGPFLFLHDDIRAAANGDAVPEEFTKRAADLFGPYVGLASRCIQKYQLP